MGYSQIYDSSAAFYLKFVGSNSPLVEHELQIGDTGNYLYESCAVINSERLRLFYVFSALAGLAAPQAVAQSKKEHMHPEHVGGHMVQGVAEAHTQLPPLKILLPDDGATVGPQLAVVFQTAADLGKMTMDGPAGTHLHIEAQDISVMPSREQLVRLGGDRYLFLFDVPSKPGKSVLRIYWSDAQHETIANTVQQITVTVAPPDGAQ